MPCEELGKFDEGLIFEVDSDFASVNQIPDHVLEGLVYKLVFGEGLFFSVDESYKDVGGFEFIRHAEAYRAEIPVSEV